MLAILMSAHPLCVAAEPQSLVELPGWGISSSAPADIQPGRFGNYLIDPSGQLIILLMAAESKVDLEKDAEYLAVNYPQAPEQFNNGKVSGRLYRRSRVGNVGAWDGAWLNIVRGRRSLSVTISYTGPQEQSEQQFKRMQVFFDGLEWDDTEVDMETAFGASVRVPGLLPVNMLAGGLVYSPTGALDAKSPSLQVTAMPFTLPDGVEFGALCTPAIARAFKDRPFTGPYIRKKNDFVLCDAWSSTGKGETQYLALLKVSAYQFLTAMAYVPDHKEALKPEQLRDAMLKIELLR